MASDVVHHQALYRQSTVRMAGDGSRDRFLATRGDVVVAGELLEALLGHLVVVAPSGENRSRPSSVELLPYNLRS